MGDYQNIQKKFEKIHIQNLSEKDFVIKKVKNTLPFRTEKMIQKKGDKLYVKWEGYDNLFNS